MPDNARPKYQILVASMDIQQDASNYMQNINKITQPFPEIMMIYFRELVMLEHTQLKQHDNTVASLDV